MIYVLLAAIAITIVRYAAAVRREGSFRILLELPASALAGLLGGAWLGIAARGAMRIIAMANGSSVFSMSGSLQVVGVFALIGAGIGILYAGLFRHALTSSGLRFGLLLLLVTWWPLAEEGIELLGDKPGVVMAIIGSGAVLSAMWLPYSLIMERSLGCLRPRML